MTDSIALVREFHETYNQPVRTVPTLDIPKKEAELRYHLIKEELEELREAIDANDLVGIYDALLDIDWVTQGGILAWGLNYHEGLEAVAHSNRTKLGEDGKPIYNPETGKVVKGPNFVPPEPQLQRIIDAAQETTGRG